MIRFIAPLLLAASLSLASPAHAAPSIVDVNKASQAELETVKGIGPAMSGKILAARKSGDFKDWEDLVQRVSGMGPGNARRMSEAGLRVGPHPFQNATAVATKPARVVGASYRSAKPAPAAGERSRGEAARPAGTPAPTRTQG
ncbi:MAG: ComEA family DNA-binding protein [Rubrivivax sp.]